ncbi:MAG: glycosyltransferase family 4 protein [bacterium]
MRIAFVADPASVHVARWVREFERRGITCRLYGPASDEQEWIVEATPIGRPGLYGVHSTTALVADLREKLARFRPDLIHAHFALNYGTWAALSGTRPMVLTCMGTDVLTAPAKSLIARWKVSAALASADLVTVNAAHMGAAAVRLGAHEERIVRIVQGVDTDLYAAPDRSDRAGDPIILSTRMLAPVYRLDDVLRAAALLAEQGRRFRLHLAGSGPLEDELRALASRLGVADHVKFLGLLKGDEALATAYQQADIGISASASDGASVAVLEAMSCGLPIVASDIPANREWLSQGSGNFLVPVGDVPAMAAALARLIDDRALRAAARDRNRRIVCQSATWSTEMDRMESHYRRLSARPDRP